ncbi:hypothetical protein [Paenibacillus bouchesdurhonensis]|uniref:hypothetical protein n=1 Tax=Paenibacillus bouchesdurhonensis TaxID=1870990 RepID=UPI000DA62B23|nr:hypothetical protein [Paenibacillus bouchesdurhonensis]
MSLLEEGTLVIGSGPILLSLAESWYEFGLSKLTVYVTSKEPIDTGKLKEFCEHAYGREAETSLKIIAAARDEDLNWRAIVRPFQFILYVSEHGGLDELLKLQNACIAERRQMLPGILVRGMGMAGPLLNCDGNGRWESAWRRIHSSVFPESRCEKGLSVAAAGLLSNLLVHEWHKAITAENDAYSWNHCFLLDPVTLTGGWHQVLPHPLVFGYEAARPVENIERHFGDNNERANPQKWFSALNQLTSTITGIFHAWEEADLIQLPLAQCLVQPVDLLSEEPAPLLPVIIRSGLTHEEARRESGLAGLEAYAARMIPLMFSWLPSHQQQEINIGAGCDLAEAVGRGFRACLAKEFGKRTLSHEPTVLRIACTQIKDVRCQYYLQALSIIEGEPVIAVGEPLLGFPVVWVNRGSSWYVSADLSFTLALRQSLQKALDQREAASISAVTWRNNEWQETPVPDSGSLDYGSLMQSAVRTLKQHHKRLEVFNMPSKSLWGKSPFEIYGVSLEEGGVY